MSKKKRLVFGLVFYAANLIAVFLLIAYAGLSTNVDIGLAIWLVILTSIVSYETAKTYRR